MDKIDKVVLIEAALHCPNPDCGFEGLQCLKCILNKALDATSKSEDEGKITADELSTEDDLYLSADMVNDRFPEVVDDKYDFRVRTKRFNIVPIEDEGDLDERTAERQ